MGEYYCEVCGKKLDRKIRICLECRKSGLKHLIDENPKVRNELQQAYEETMEKICGTGSCDIKSDAATSFLDTVRKLNLSKKLQEGRKDEH